jgi:hypothetical protein
LFIILYFIVEKDGDNMSSFKNRFNKIRNKSIQKIAAPQPPQPAQKMVKEDPEKIGFVSQLEELLQVVIHPTQIDGFVEEYSGELTITMSNGDEIELTYKNDPEGMQNEQKLIVNGQPANLNPGFQVQDIATEYKRIFDMNNM